MIQQRLLRAADLPRVLQIQDDCYREIVPESRRSLRAKLLASGDTCFAAEAAGELVAYLIAVPVLYPELPVLDAPTFGIPAGADTLYIHDLAVARAGRGTGAGQALARSALHAGRQRRLAQACLVAIQGSSSYWEQFGFEAVAAPTAGVSAKLASYGANALLMRAPL